MVDKHVHLGVYESVDFDPNAAGQVACSGDGMKKPMRYGGVLGVDTGQIPLVRRRAIEQQLGVFLEPPLAPDRSRTEQYGVYDEDGIYVDDVRSEDRYFTTDELIAKIKKIFAQ